MIPKELHYLFKPVDGVRTIKGHLFYHADWRVLPPDKIAYLKKHGVEIIINHKPFTMEENLKILFNWKKFCDETNTPLLSCLDYISYKAGIPITDYLHWSNFWTKICDGLNNRAAFQIRRRMCIFMFPNLLAQLDFDDVNGMKKILSLNRKKYQFDEKEKSLIANYTNADDKQLKKELQAICKLPITKCTALRCKLKLTKMNDTALLTKNMFKLLDVREKEKIRVAFIENDIDSIRNPKDFINFEHLTAFLNLDEDSILELWEQFIGNMSEFKLKDHRDVDEAWQLFASQFTPNRKLTVSDCIELFELYSQHLEKVAKKRISYEEFDEILKNNGIFYVDAGRLSPARTVWHRFYKYYYRPNRFIFERLKINLNNSEKYHIVLWMLKYEWQWSKMEYTELVEMEKSNKFVTNLTLDMIQKKTFINWLSRFKGMEKESKFNFRLAVAVELTIIYIKRFKKNDFVPPWSLRDMAFTSGILGVFVKDDDSELADNRILEKPEVVSEDNENKKDKKEIVFMKPKIFKKFNKKCIWFLEKFCLIVDENAQAHEGLYSLIKCYERKILKMGITMELGADFCEVVNFLSALYDAFISNIFEKINVSYNAYERLHLMLWTLKMESIWSKRDRKEVLETERYSEDSSDLTKSFASTKVFKRYLKKFPEKLVGTTTARWIIGMEMLVVYTKTLKIEEFVPPWFLSKLVESEYVKRCFEPGNNNYLANGDEMLKIKELEEDEGDEDRKERYFTWNGNELLNLGINGENEGEKTLRRKNDENVEEPIDERKKKKNRKRKNEDSYGEDDENWNKENQGSNKKKKKRQEREVESDDRESSNDVIRSDFEDEVARGEEEEQLTVEKKKKTKRHATDDSEGSSTIISTEVDNGAVPGEKEERLSQRKETDEGTSMVSQAESVPAEEEGQLSVEKKKKKKKKHATDDSEGSIRVIKTEIDNEDVPGEKEERLNQRIETDEGTSMVSQADSVSTENEQQLSIEKKKKKKKKKHATDDSEGSSRVIKAEIDNEDAPGGKEERFSQRNETDEGTSMVSQADSVTAEEDREKKMKKKKKKKKRQEMNKCGVEDGTGPEDLEAESNNKETKKKRRHREDIKSLLNRMFDD